jgi:hypothetical protein
MNPDEAQTVLFTIIPRGITIGTGPLPVSVIVSPRLSGDDKLSAYPDWLFWTHVLKERGLRLIISCGSNQQRFAIDQAVLQPDLWEQLFNKETFVRSYEFPDYSERGLISFSMRETLSAIKTVYQEAAIELALPGEARGIQEEGGGNRDKLAEMLAGLDIHWNGEVASRWRSVVRRLNRPGRENIRSRTAGIVDSEGLIVAPRDAADFQKAALPFAVFHHMPTPKQEDNPVAINTDDVIDFHQALSSLNSYPALLRALGLVFDLDLPADFVATTAPGQFDTLSVSATSLEWQTPTTTPALKTAYVNLAFGPNRLFLTAPLILKDPSAVITAVGLINLDPTSFGLAQVDVDGAMHKTIMLADTMNNPDPDHNVYPDAGPEPAPHPEIYDRDATLPSLRSGGFSLYADQRGVQLLETMLQSKAFNDAVEAGGAQSRPFFAEDLLRGYRLDVWDSHTSAWHSLHRRTGTYRIGNKKFAPGEEEGFVQTAAMQPAPGAAEGPDGEDLYLHEAIARWAGWSLSVPMPGKHLSRYGDPDKAVPPDNDPTGEYLEDQPDTPFKMTVDYDIVSGSLPRLVFGRRYRLRARAVDLAGNSLRHDELLSEVLSSSMALPRNPNGQPYLRYEPVISPLVVIREPQAVTGPGSAVDRLVIRTFNSDSEQDAAPADTGGADRHLLPPRTSVEMGERLGMFDDDAGKLKGDAATWQLIADRDAGELNHEAIAIAGNPPVEIPVEPAGTINSLPYLPDPLAAGVALRDLPGTPGGTLARIEPGGSEAVSIDYPALDDPNPRPGSATLISFDEGSGDWKNLAGIRLSLVEPAADQEDLRPQWDPAKRLLSVFLPKGQTAIVPLSATVSPPHLKLMGQWEWLRQYIELVTVLTPQPQYLQPGAAVDRVNHILQRAVEGGHWLLNPPLLLTFVHAVQQPLGIPTFTALNVDHDDDIVVSSPLHTAPVRDRQDPVELAPITAWRRLGSTDAYLMGALRIHGASSAKIDLHAEWSEPIDDLSQPAWQMVNRTAHAETIPLPDQDEGYLHAPELYSRPVGYYDPESDQIAFVRFGDRGGPLDQTYGTFFVDAAPRQQFNDTKRRQVVYTAVATSRYREYFPTDAEQEATGLEPLDFTRRSRPIAVDVPASARPLAPVVAYVLPTFGWQRQTETNVKRSVRFGGGLRVYLERPWFSSGEGELLGIALWSSANGLLNTANRDKFKAYFTQWGMDPIWKSANLGYAPAIYHFPDSVAMDYNVSLEERTVQLSNGVPGRVNVVGYPVTFDPIRKQWFADLTIRTDDLSYMPFIRLALVRYQPHALVDAQISRVVLADFAQITPDRSVLVTVDPHTPRQLRVVISGVAPAGPAAVVMSDPAPHQIAPRPTQIKVRVQINDSPIESDLTWRDLNDAQIVQVSPIYDGSYPGQPYLELWAGTVTFTSPLPPARHRLLIQEFEYISADYTLAMGDRREQPGRLIYAETIELDEGFLPTG